MEVLLIDPFMIFCNVGKHKKAYQYKGGKRQWVNHVISSMGKKHRIMGTMWKWGKQEAWLKSLRKSILRQESISLKRQMEIVIGRIKGNLEHSFVKKVAIL